MRTRQSLGAVSKLRGPYLDLTQPVGGFAEHLSRISRVSAAVRDIFEQAQSDKEAREVLTSVLPLLNTTHAKRVDQKRESVRSGSLKGIGRGTGAITHSQVLGAAQSASAAVAPGLPVSPVKPRRDKPSTGNTVRERKQVQWCAGDD